MNTSILRYATAEQSGLDPVRWRQLIEFARGACHDDHMPALAVQTGRNGFSPGPVFLGRQSLGESPEALRDDAIFLVASITKPIVAMGLLRLVEQGRLTLGDRVADWVSGFSSGGRNGIRIRHLLTHSSGLPDMLPDNLELRATHQPLSRFVEGTRHCDLEFVAGHATRYQSMGFALLGQIIEQISGRSCGRFLRDEFFEPLGMNDTALGPDDDWLESRNDRLAEIRIPSEQVGTDWGWNSRYWRQLGAPWGGLLTTPADLAIFAQMMLNEGSYGGLRFLSPMTVRAATANQSAALRDLPEADRRFRPWGYGWRLHWPAHSANFGDLLGERTYGHWGATGTVLWLDPDQQAFAILLSTQPQEPRGTWLARISNGISGAMI